MTTPPGFKTEPRRVMDAVRKMVPFMRQPFSPGELALGIHLRGNVALYESLTGIIKARLEGRASLPEPSDPLKCKSVLARDGELRWLLSRLELIHQSPALQPVEQPGEQPA